MTKEATKRIGRPMKAPARGERVSLGLKVTADIKRRLDGAARASGRTQSQEAEHRIELSYQYERALGDLEEARKKLVDDLKQLEKTFAAARQDSTERALKRSGWEKFLAPEFGGNVWLPPGRHDFPKSGWRAPDDTTPLRPGRIITDPEFVVDAVKAMATEIAQLKAALKKEGGK